MSGYADQASAAPTPTWFDRLQSTIRWLVYPALLGGAMALLWALFALGASLAWALAAPCRPSPTREALYHQRFSLPSGRKGAAVPARHVAVHARRDRYGRARVLFCVLFDEWIVSALQLRRAARLAQLSGQR